MSSSTDLYFQLHGIISKMPGAAETALDKAKKQAADEGAAKLRATAPKRSGASAKSWDVKTQKGKVIIYSKPPHYRVAHLLEFGHKTVGTNGKRKTKAFNYIKPVEVEENQRVVKYFEENLNRELGKI